MCTGAEAPAAEAAAGGAKGAADVAAGSAIANPITAVGVNAAAATEGALAAGTAGTAGALSTIKDVATVAAPIAATANAVEGAKAARRASPGLRLPSVEASRPTPIMGGPTSTLAENAAYEALARRRGRASTILTDSGSGDKLGA